MTALLGVCAVLAAGGCDHAGKLLELVPEFDFTESFEAGLGDWTPQALDVADPAVTWSVEASSEEASAGTQSVKLTLDNANAAGKIWIERELEVDPGQAYDVTLSFDLASADFGTVNLWKVIAGAYTAPPRTAAELSFPGDTGNGASADDGVHWVSRSYQVHARADKDGYIYVVIGVWGTYPVARTYWVDNVHVQLTRTG